jgi:outer membrane receptor for ferric coprogen and ferric-rhodotorulic acid
MCSIKVIMSDNNKQQPTKLAGCGKLTPVAFAVQLVFVGSILVLGTPDRAIAQTTSAAQQAVYTFNIPAGDLANALRSAGSTAGVILSFTPAQTNGKQTQGVTGSYTFSQALQALLAGTGLTSERSPNGSYAVRTLAGGEAGVLPEVTVTAQAGRDGATEGTGAYVSTAAITTATPLGLTLRETPQSVSVITSQRMEDQGLTTIQQTLAQVPGVKTGSLGTELNNANARGYSFSNYQFDGVNSFVEVLGGGGVSSATTADMAFYDRIEVLRGASGLVTGAGDPAGTINMVRKKPTAEFQGIAEVAVGSWNDKRGVLDVSGSLNEARSVRGRLVAVAQDSDSYIDHYSKNKGGFYGVVEADLTSTTRLTGGVEYERSKVKGQGGYIGFPLWYVDGTRTDFPVSFSTASRDNWLKLESTKVFTTLEQQLGNAWKLKFSASHAETKHEEERVFLLFNSNFSDTAGDGLRLNASRREARIKQNNLNLDVSGPFTLFGRQHELVLGAAYETYDQPVTSYADTSGLSGTPANLLTWDRTGAGVYGPVSVDGRYEMRQTSVYGATRFQVSDKLKLIAGLRVFWQDYKFAEVWSSGKGGSSSSEDGVFTPYGGIVYDFNDVHTAYASYSTIYKPQTVRDRYGAVLDPREGTNLEAGIKSGWLDGRLNTTVALYQVRQDNLAVSDPGQIVPGTIDTAAYRAVKGAKTTGIDVEVAGAISPNWNVSASWAYGHSKDGDDKRINTTFPSHMVKLWTTYRMPGNLNGLTIGGGVNWQSKTYSTVDAWPINRDVYWEQNAFAVANLMARYEFNKQLSATLNVNNLFDKKYINSVSDWWYSGNYGAPRSVALNLKYRF